MALKLDKALPPIPLSPKQDSTTHTVLDHPPVEPVIAPKTIKASAPVKRAASRPLPFRVRHMDMTIPEHKPRPIPGITLAQPSATMDLALRDVPSTPSVFSPRVAEFTAAPFGLQGAGDLVTPGNRKSKDIPTSFSWLPVRKEGHVRTASKDPRSPHHQDEGKEILRSIDHYL